MSSEGIKRSTTASQGAGPNRILDLNSEENKKFFDKRSIDNYKALNDAGIEVNGKTMTSKQIDETLNKEVRKLSEQYESALNIIKKAVGNRPDQKDNIFKMEKTLENLKKPEFEFKLNDYNNNKNDLGTPDIDEKISFLLRAKKGSEDLVEQMIVAGMTNFFDGNLPEGYSKGASGSPVGGVPAAIATVIPAAVRNREIITRMINSGKEIINTVKSMTLKPEIKVAANRALQTLEGHVAKLEKLLDPKQVEAMPNKTYNDIFSMVTANNAELLELFTIITELKATTKQ